MSEAMLYDATVCIGCKQCEQACAKKNRLHYDDTVAAEQRQSDHKYTGHTEAQAGAWQFMHNRRMNLSPLVRTMTQPALLVEACLHAEDASTGFFELGSVDNDGSQGLLFEDPAQIGRHTRSNVAAVGHHSVGQKGVSFITADFMHSRPMLTNCSQRTRRERSRVNQDRLVIEGAETGIEVVAVGIDEGNGDDRESEIAHRRCEPFDASACGTKSIARPDRGLVGMPDQVTMAFKAFAFQVEGYHFISTVAKPLDIIGDFLLANETAHFSGHDEVADPGAMSDEDLVGGEHHVFELRDRIDSNDCNSGIGKGAAQLIPLLVGAGAVDGQPHVGILGLAHIKERWRAHEDASRHGCIITEGLAGRASCPSPSSVF